LEEVKNLKSTFERYFKVIDILNDIENGQDHKNE